jgi:bifunctional ADP-heptose synthase (sugar kinase/adenylyltransferase)
MRLDEGETNGISPLLSLDTEIIGKILRSDIVIISDYNKGYLSEDIISKITEKSKFSVMDSKKRLTEKSIENLNFVKLNEIEYNQNKQLVSDNLEKFVITLGSKGAMFLNEVFGSNKPQETIDVSGAGDSFISAFTLMYYKTTDIKVSINFANEVCSDVVSKKGVSLPDKKFKISF